MTRTGSPGARRGARITSGGGGGDRPRRRDEGRSGRQDEPANRRRVDALGARFPAGRHGHGHGRRRCSRRRRRGGGRAAAAAHGRRRRRGARAGGGCGDHGRRRRGRRGGSRLGGACRACGRGRAPFGRGPEADAHARGRRIRRLDDLGHARVPFLVVDLERDRGADRQRLAEHDERPVVGLIANLRRPPHHHPAVSNLCGAIHDRKSTPARGGSDRGFARRG